MLIRALRIGWPIAAGLTVLLSILAIPAARADLVIPCSEKCTNSRAPSDFAATFTAAGYPLELYAAYIIALCLLVVASCLIVGSLAYLIQPGTSLTLSAAYGVALWPLASTPLVGFLRDSPLGPLTGILAAVATSASMWFFLTFPTGQFAPSWTRWVLIFYLVISVPRRLGWLSTLGPLAFLEPLAFVLILVVLIYSWVYRYRSVGNQRLRQQMKWAIFGFAASLIGFVLSLSFGSLFVTGVLHAEVAPFALLVGSAGVYLSLASIPIWLAVAILRHRLYDVDVLIKRTVVYGATSAAIAVTFFLGIVLLQPALRPLTNGTELAVAVSTLGSFALFQPVRRRVHDAVDRRFDRSRYDSARTLESFAERLRDEVNLEELRRDLIGAVGQTMAPTHTSLWLRER